MKIANFIAKLFGNRNERQNSPDPETSAGAVNISAPIVRQKTELTNPIISGDEPMPSPQIQTLGGTVPDVPNNIASLPASQLPLGSSDPQNIAPTVAPRPVTEAEPLAEVTPRFGSPEYQKTRDEIDRLQKKDYSLKKDENGNVIQRGKDRDKDHNWWDSVKGAGIGALKGFAATGNLGGALGGAVTGGIQGAVDRNYDEKFVNNWKIQQQQQKAAEIFKRDRAEQDWLFNENARKLALEKERATIDEIKRKPEKEENDRAFKLNMEAKKQLDRLRLLTEKDRISDANYKGISIQNGKLFKEFKDGRFEPIINPATGEQEVELLKQPEEIEVADGTNADGTPKTKKVYMTGGQAANLEATKNYRQQIIDFNKERLKENKNQFQQRMKLDVEKFNQAKYQFQTTVDLRKQAMANIEAARARKDEQAALRYELDMKELDAKIAQMKQALLKAKSNMELDDDQFNELDSLIK